MNITDSGADYLREAIVMQSVHDLTCAYKYKEREYSQKVYLLNRIKRLEERVKFYKMQNVSPISTQKKLEATRSKFYKIQAAEKTINECESFFRSPWFHQLCSLDGEAIIKQCRKNANIEKKTLLKRRYTREQSDFNW